MSASEQHSELTAARAHLEVLASELTRFSHDVQNPLSILSGNIELINAMSGEGAFEPAVQESFDDIQVAIGKLAEIVGRLQSIRERVSEIESAFSAQ